MRKIFLFLVICISLSVSAYAKEITLSVNQSEYYFLLGEQAVIPLTIESTYDNSVDGLFTYTLTQEINQGSVHYSSTNSQSKSFTVENGKKTISLGFGTSDSPLTLRVHTIFSYSDKEAIEVELGDILIHFVSDNSQKQENNEQMESKSQTGEQKQEEQQNKIQQQMEQMQKQMDEMFNQQQQPQNPVEQVQNNQMPQDSSALKQQMQEQIQEQQQMKEQFQKNLANNPDFQKEHQQLLSQGYNISGGNLNPLSNNSGDFELNYQKGEETAKLSGSMENNTITELQKSSSEDLKKFMGILQNNEEYKKFDSKLKSQGFSQKNPEIKQNKNQTILTIPYINKKNESASITAIFEKEEVKEIVVEGLKNNSYFNYILIFSLLVLISILSYLIYVKYFKKTNKEIQEIKPEKPIDYKKEALKILEESKRLFKSNKEKDAYGKAAEALRFYFSYKIGSKVEITNNELINLLKKSKMPYSDTQKCLNLCQLVEFAKYKANQEDFDEIIELAEKAIV